MWVLLALDLAAMEGPQEFLSGKFRLSFNPSARTSVLMLRLNDAALRALQECQRQQVRPAPGSISPSPYPSGPRASAGDPSEGTWGWGAEFTGSSLSTSPSAPSEAGPSGRSTPDPRDAASPALSSHLCSPRRFHP